MSRYSGPKLRIVRRLGDLPGLTTKVTERTAPPGQHGPGKAGKKSSLSEYGIRLQEKQKLRFNYGLSEKQLFNYVKEARRLPGATGSILLQLLEMRLDNIVYRLGFASTIPGARQLVNHGHVLVNGKKVDIPSFQCNSNDTVIIRSKKLSQDLAKKSIDLVDSRQIPNYLELDKEGLKGKVLSIINREDVGINVNELLIVEFYSRK
jgi:small subunit ribosomal protein S4